MLRDANFSSGFVTPALPCAAKRKRLLLALHSRRLRERLPTRCRIRRQCEVMSIAADLDCAALVWWRRQKPDGNRNDRAGHADANRVSLPQMGLKIKR